MAVIYEVTVVVQRRLEASYRSWLDDHVREIVALPGFTGASVSDVVDPAPAADEFAICMQYRLVDDAALANYLREHAPRLRADGIERFGDGFRASRRVLHTGANY